MESQNTNQNLISVEIPLTIQFRTQKVQFPKGQIQISDKNIIFSQGDILLTFKYQSIISAGKSKLDLLLFLRNGNPQQQQVCDQEQQQEGTYQDKILLAELKQVINKKYSFQKQIKGKFTVSFSFKDYDHEVLKAHYEKILQYMAEYQPESNNFENIQKFSPELEEMGNIMAEIVNDYNNQQDD